MPARGADVSDGSELIGYIGGGTGITAAVGFLFKYIWDSVQKKTAKLEATAEEDEKKDEKKRDEKMDAVLAKLGAMELDMRSLLEKHATQIGAIAEVKSRIEGISTNYGARLGTIEQSLVEIRTRVVGLEDNRPKRK